MDLLESLMLMEHIGIYNFDFDYYNKWFFNAFNISDKEFPYLIWMILAFLMTKIVKCLVITQVLGGSYVGIACMGASIRNFDKNTKSWKAMLFLALIYSC